MVQAGEPTRYIAAVCAPPALWLFAIALDYWVGKQESNDG